MTVVRIAAIEQVPGKRDSYIIRFDDGSELKAPGAVIVRFGLYAGMETEAQTLRDIREEIGRQGARAQAARIVGAHPLSEQELKLRLTKRGVKDENAQDAADWLRELGALDDAAYAHSLAQSYAAKGYGRAKIKDEFYKHAVPRELWDDALSDYEAPEEQLDRFIASKLRGTVPDRGELKKLSDALYRRGFSWDEIRDALARYTPEE